MNKPTPLDNIRIVLSHPAHPGNIGAAARAMKTMGLTQLYLVNPKSFPDRQAQALAAGAGDVLEQARICSDMDEALAGVTLAVACTARQRDLSHPMLSAREAAPVMLAHAASQPVALVFGTEMSGLSNAELDKCQLLTHIHSNPECSSLNLAAAVQVLAYELRCALPEVATIKSSIRDLADLEDVERFYQHLERVLIEVKFLDPDEPKRLMSRLRRMFARAGLEQSEVNILRGILTAVRNT